MIHVAPKPTVDSQHPQHRKIPETWIIVIAGVIIGKQMPTCDLNTITIIVFTTTIVALSLLTLSVLTTVGVCVTMAKKRHNRSKQVRQS